MAYQNSKQLSIGSPCAHPYHRSDRLLDSPHRRGLRRKRPWNHRGIREFWVNSIIYRNGNKQLADWLLTASTFSLWETPRQMNYGELAKCGWRELTKAKTIDDGPQNFWERTKSNFYQYGTWFFLFLLLRLLFKSHWLMLSFELFTSPSDETNCKMTSAPSIISPGVFFKKIRRKP